MSQAIYTHYGGLMVDLKAGVQYDAEGGNDGLTNNNASQILSKIFTELSSQLPIITLTYELGNIFTLTLNLAEHKYVVYNITVAKRNQVKYARALLTSFALTPYASITDEQSNVYQDDENVVNLIQNLSNYGLGFTPVIIYADSRNSTNELENFKEVMKTYVSNAPYAFFITNRGYRANELEIEGYKMTASVGFYIYVNEGQLVKNPADRMMPENSELYRAVLASSMVQEVNNAKIESYIDWVNNRIGEALELIELSPEKKEQILTLYRSPEMTPHLLRAITTADYTFERPENDKNIDYEVYEMIGDRVWELNFVRYLKVRFPNITPEQLTNIKIYFLSKNNQQKLALEIGLSYFLLSGYKTTDIKLYEDILEAFAESIVVVGNQAVQGLGMEIQFYMLANIFNRIQIDVNDKRFKPAKTYVKEVLVKAGLPPVKQNIKREETTAVLTLTYPIKLKAIQISESTLVINERDQTIISTARSNEEAETKAYEALRTMLINSGYDLERYSGLLPQAIRNYEKEFLKIEKMIGAQDFSIRTTAEHGASIGVSGVIEFLIDGQWVRYSTAIGRTQKECYEHLMKFLILVAQQLEEQ